MILAGEKKPQQRNRPGNLQKAQGPGPVYTGKDLLHFGLGIGKPNYIRETSMKTNSKGLPMNYWKNSKEKN